MVLASDCVASIWHWGVRDSFGQALMQRTDEITARDDKTIVFHLKQSFALLSDALGQGAPPCVPSCRNESPPPIRSSRSPGWSAAVRSDLSECRAADLSPCPPGHSLAWDQTR
jgi:hypothetical protein